MQLEMSKKYQRDCKAIRAGPNLWQVSSGPKTYAVNLEEHTCGCRKWDMSGLPCNHGCSAIYKAKMQPEDFVSPFLRKAMYLEAYKPIVYPVPGEDAWDKSGKPDIEPPVFHKEDQSGRKEEKRKINDSKDVWKRNKSYYSLQPRNAYNICVYINIHI